VADVALAGHTHGGQVRIPMIRPFWLPSGSGSYFAGWYAGSHGGLYVSRGLGTSLLPIRFLARPEVFLLTLQGQGSSG
jgi:predicted MPP superfamily phosphohydrolase